MLAIDVSTSMLAEDLKPNRLEAAKDVAAEFINGRPNDNIGITLFAGETFTQCPLTVDHAVLLDMIHNIKCGLIEDGTAVGMGVANAVTRLKDSKAKSKVIILLTDGTNNKGDISPLTAAEIAKIYIAAQTLITTQTTYHNALKAYVQSLEGAEEISAVTYGMTLPEPYLSEMNAKLAVAQAQMNAITEKLGN